MTDIKAQIAELRSYKDANATTEQLWLQNLMAADALERQQADIQRKDEAFKSAVAQISEYGARMDNMEAVVDAARGYGRGEFGWPRKLKEALAALDALPEGDAE